MNVDDESLFVPDVADYQRAFRDEHPIIDIVLAQLMWQAYKTHLRRQV